VYEFTLVPMHLGWARHSCSDISVTLTVVIMDKDE